MEQAPAHASNQFDTQLPPPGEWPLLRNDLVFHRVADNAESPSWLLYDPLRGQYLELGEVEILILQHWHRGSIERIIAAITQHNGCTIEPRRIEALRQFCLNNELFQCNSDQVAEFQSRGTVTQKRLRQLQQTLFWRRPLFTPTISSQLLAPLARCTARPVFYLLLAVLAAFCAISIGQHWHEFLGYFNASWNPVGTLTFFCCYLMLSVFHELGHSSVARLYGVQSNSIGIGLIALMPIMYSEITDAWRLPRTARLHISAAGVAFELTLGVAAALAWCLLDDGPVRALMFYLFTTSLITTLLINANPLMKFDGYFLLSDVTGEKNLHQSATNALRTRVWSLLLRDIQAPPGARQRLLAGFGLACLIYRLFIFAVIAYGAYLLLFKVAGVVIFVLCLGLLFIVPGIRECKMLWAQLQKHEPKAPDHAEAPPPTAESDNAMPMKADADARAALRNFAHTAFVKKLGKFHAGALMATGCFLLLLFVPLPWPVQIPASTFFTEHQRAEAPTSALLKTFSLTRGSMVEAGQPLAVLQDEQLEYRITRTEKELRLLQRRLQSDGFAQSLDALDAIYLQDLLSKQQLLRALNAERTLLQISAEISGTVDWVQPGLYPGQFLELNQPFISIVNRDSLAGRAYAEAEQVARLTESLSQPQFSGHLFLQGQWQPIAVRVQAIEQIASRAVQDPALASEHGGPLQVQPDNARRSAKALHLITFALETQQQGAPAVTTAQRTGHLVLLGRPESLAALISRRIAGILVRESGV
ncbi:hypothetical protein [Microbulbifer sp. Q7]|uniref:hypothetical protein n=1 Tax=Microbulbifer sp. Q7 TaxID=1785091 RepID=UPI00082F5E87|nr:hypothetical protein [Microbulbifer sp. Q7]